MKTMNIISALKEKNEHGTEEFPVAFYDSYQIIPHHWHDEEEFIYMVEGEADYNIDGHIIHLKAGDCAYCKGKSLHSMLFEQNIHAQNEHAHSEHAQFEHVQFEHVHFYALLFLQSYLFKENDICLRLIRDIRPRSFYALKNPDDCKIISQIKNLCSLMQQRSFGYELEVKQHLIKLYTQILKNKLYSEAAEPKVNLMDMNIVSAIPYIHSNFSQKISVDQLAELAGYSTPYFERLFKIYTGKTPVEYLILFRLRQAQRMLMETNLNVLEISDLCGFSNVSYFIRRFKAQYEITPYQYKRSSITLSEYKNQLLNQD